MTRPQAAASRRIGGLLTLLGLISSSLYSAQVFKYKNTKPENGYLIQNVAGEKWLKRNLCGPACLAMVLNYWDGKGSFSQQGNHGRYLRQREPGDL